MMKSRENLLKEKDEFKAYLSQINRDWWVLKGQLIFAAIVLAGIFLFAWFYLRW